MKSRPPALCTVGSPAGVDPVKLSAAPMRVTMAASVMPCSAACLVRDSMSSALRTSAHTIATGETIDGKPHIHAVMAIQGDRAVAGHMIQADFGTSFAHAYVIPSEQHIAPRTNEGVVLKYFAGDGPRVGVESSTSESRPSTSTSEPIDGLSIRFR
jgi:hypothetical protein